MANRQINVTLLMRNDPAATWAAQNPILSKGEIGIENDTRKFKIGDGSTAWNALKYASGGNVELNKVAPTETDTDFEVGTIWVDTAAKQAYLLFAKDTTATWIELATAGSTVAKAKVAEKLAVARTITLNGAVVETAKTFDGGGNITFTLVLENSGVTAGTYTKLTVNEKGIVTGFAALNAADLPSITLSKVSDAGTAAGKDVGTSAGNVPLLDASGKLDTKVLPALALTETYTVDSQSAMLALKAQQGDVAIRTDVAKTFILVGTDPATLDDWKELKTPDCKVLSVNGKTGAITLSTTDVAEGTNLYFTETRATSNFNTNFAQKSVANLKDGANVLLSTDTFTLNGGNA